MAWDDVDLFGFNGLGEPDGFSAIYGAMIGAGVATAAEIGTSQFWPSQEVKGNAELVGLGAGLLVAAGMIAHPYTRHAGWTAGAVTLISNGLRAVRKKYGGMAGMGMVRAGLVPPTAGFGQVGVRPVPPTAGLGMVQGRPLGAVPGVNLLGRGTNMAASYGTSYANR